MSRSGFIAFVKNAFNNIDSVDDYNAFMQELPLKLDQLLGGEMDEDARLRSELEQQIAANDATFSQMQTEAQEFKAELGTQSEADEQSRSQLEQLQQMLAQREEHHVAQEASVSLMRSELRELQAECCNLRAEQHVSTAPAAGWPVHSPVGAPEQAVPRLPLEEAGRLSDFFQRTPPGSARSSGSEGVAAVIENARDPTRAMQVAAQRLLRGQTERPTANTDAVVQLAMTQARLRREAAERRAVDAQIQEERVVQAMSAREAREENKKARVAAREQKRKDSDDKRRKEAEIKKQKLELDLLELENKLKK